MEVESEEGCALVSAGGSAGCLRAHCTSQDKERKGSGSRTLQFLLTVDGELSYVVDEPGRAHDETQICARPIDELASRVGCTVKQYVAATRA